MKKTHKQDKKIDEKYYFLNGFDLPKTFTVLFDH